MQSIGGGIDNSNSNWWQEVTISNMHGTGSDAEMMDLDAGGEHGQHKRSHLAMQMQTSGIGRCFRISPTTVLDSDSDGVGDCGDVEKTDNTGDSSDCKKRRKTPDDAPLIVAMTSSEVVATIVQRFSSEGTQITKVTVGTYGRDRARSFFGSQRSDYVSVHFSADGKRWGELRTTDGTHALHHIGDAALASIQAYLRSAK